MDESSSLSLSLLRMVADEPRNDDLSPETHRLLSFWQAQNACENTAKGIVRRDPNFQKPIPYELNVKYWLWALGSQQTVDQFLAVGQIITKDMNEEQQHTMNDFIATLPTQNLRDNEALERIFDKTADVFDATKFYYA